MNGQGSLTTAALAVGGHTIAAACSGDSTTPTNDGNPNTVSGARSGRCGSPGF